MADLQTLLSPLSKELRDELKELWITRTQGLSDYGYSRRTRLLIANAPRLILAEELLAEANQDLLDMRSDLESATGLPAGSSLDELSKAVIDMSFERESAWDALKKAKGLADQARERWHAPLDALHEKLVRDDWDRARAELDR